MMFMKKRCGNCKLYRHGKPEGKKTWIRNYGTCVGKDTLTPTHANQRACSGWKQRKVMDNNPNFEPLTLFRGEIYMARINGKLVYVRLTAEHLFEGWDAVNLATGRYIHIKSEKQIVGMLK